MIFYFCDRGFNVLGHASTSLNSTYVIVEDTKKEATDTGVSSMDATVAFTDDTRSNIEAWCMAGNYVLTYNGDEKTESKNALDCFMIVESELSVTDREITFYGENSGLDLLNNLAGAYTGTATMSAGDYVSHFLEGTGFSLRNDTVSASPKLLEWTDTETVTKRLQDIASQFGAELSYGFTVSGMKITERYVDIADEIGTSTDYVLYINKQVNNITVKKTIENLATAVFAKGKDSITLEDFIVPTEDADRYEIDPNGNLVSLDALEKWKRYNVSSDAAYTGNLYYQYESNDYETQEDLYNAAKAKLDSISDIEVNYEVDIVELPQPVGIGDRLTIVDDAGNTYVSGRILELETSVTNGTKKATLGEYIIESAGISETVERLANEFANISKARELYTWICYADTIDGEGISLESDGKAYLGTAVNQLTEEPSIADPSIYTFVKVKGEQGEQGEKGDKGDTGAQGIQGEKGETGAQGAQGAKGDKGDTGAQGEQGIQGEKGEQGAQGISITNVTSTNNTADGGTSVITVTLSDGTQKTFNVKNGNKGSTGDTGETAQWFFGAELTHTTGTATLSVDGAVVGAMYLNTSTSLVYKCTAISGATMTWTYAGNMTDGVYENLEPLITEVSDDLQDAVDDVSGVNVYQYIDANGESHDVIKRGSTYYYYNDDNEKVEVEESVLQTDSDGLVTVYRDGLSDNVIDIGADIKNLEDTVSKNKSDTDDTAESIQSRLDTTDKAITDNQTNIAAMKDDIAAVNNYLMTIKGWVNILDGIVVGSEKGSNIKISESEIALRDKTSSMATIDSDAIHIKTADITFLRLGEYILESMSDGSLTLKVR